MMSQPHTWDIFCRVVDNLGDVGVCWRLARRLIDGQHGAVRLWVDDLACLHALCPDADPHSVRQSVAGVEVCRWSDRFPVVQPARVAIEAFGCGLPDEYVLAMVGCDPRPLWITLEYLSAESWVPAHHGLPSPHPRWPIARYFFFPGCVAGTGGLLRERGLLARREAFGDAERSRFWQSLGFEPTDGATAISLFAYGHAPVAGLLAAWEQGAEPMVLAVPQGKIVEPVLAWFGITGEGIGRSFRRGNLEARILPFMPQSRYDELLWACDCNFVRGEDSFVRAQWAARPFVWHIYPQQERAHWRKLEAFLDLYCEGLPMPAAQALRGIWRSWNGIIELPHAIAEAWREFQAHQTTLGSHARAWTACLAAGDDMVDRLVKFCRDRLE